MKNNRKITSLDKIVDKKYGKKGQPKRELWEQQFEAFRLGALLEEARTKLGMTQEELADKCGTNKSYISRIENNVSDIRLSTLMKIIQQGLGGQLILTLKQKKKKKNEVLHLLMLEQIGIFEKQSLQCQ